MIEHYLFKERKLELNLKINFKVTCGFLDRNNLSTSIEKV